MALSNDHIVSLVYQSLAGTLSGDELAELDEWLNASPKRRAWYFRMQEGNELSDSFSKQSPAQLQSLEKELYARIQSVTEVSEKPPVISVNRVHFLKTAWFRWAAAIILIFGASAYLFYNTPKNAYEIVIVNPAPLKNDVLPGKHGAVLTLADGSNVVLDNLGNGVIATQNGSRVVLKDGQLAYGPTGNDAAEIAYNTMTTPKGRQFRVMLPDGTAVWLNAASSIRYPTVFNGPERNVEITGEVYLEVAKDGKSPFKVKVNEDVAIEVLGTYFNVNAYTNEPSIRSTLLEGRVRVKNGNHQKTLLPNQQAIISGTDLKVTNVSTDGVVAWKNGLFNFNGADLPTLMRQLERWYDIQVKYEGQIQQRMFRGKMQRSLNLSQVLETLTDLNVNFRLEGRTLIVD